jgi:hypothetical protein
MTLLPAASLQNNRSGADLGTLGCFAVRKSNPNAQVLLSNNHVIYEGGRKAGEALKICSPNSGSCCCTKHVVATATDPGFEETVAGTYIDCAIAALAAGQVGVNQIPGLADHSRPLPGGPPPGGYITGWAEPVNGEPVRVGIYRNRAPLFGLVETNQVAKMSVGGFAVKRPGQLFIVVEKSQAVTVVEGSGDSGAAVFNRFNQVVGLMWGRGAHDPNSIDEASDIVFACPIGPVLKALDIDIPSALPAAPHAGAALLPVPPPPEAAAEPPVIEDELGSLRQAVRRLAETPLGRDLLAIGYRHAPEVEWLVHHHRRVTLVWHRSRGPAWTAHLINASREDDYEIPAEVGGISRADLLERMRAALYRHGSEALRADLDRWAEPLVAAATAAVGVAELIAQIEDGALGSPA